MIPFPVFGKNLNEKPEREVRIWIILHERNERNEVDNVKMHNVEDNVAHRILRTQRMK